MQQHQLPSFQRGREGEQVRVKLLKAGGPNQCVVNRESTSTAESQGGAKDEDGRRDIGE